MIVLPLFIFITIILFFVNSGKPFFVQCRVGKDEREIKIIKFKTMNDKRGTDGKLFPNQSRITRIGAIIRRASLDELPQLISVLKGELSFVGPRPLLIDYLPLYSEQQRKRHSVLPGITGWAQLHARNIRCWKQKFEYDVWYVDRASLVLDFKIFWLSLIRLWSAKGMSEKETLPRFDGTN